MIAATGRNKWSATFTYAAILLVSLMAGVVIAEIVLSHRARPRMPLPFYNKLYPYVMFRPLESYTYETPDTYEMSHHRSRVFVYTNEDGFRIPAPKYSLPKEKPAGQLRVAVLGPSVVQLASTFETTLPGSLKTLLKRRYPGRDIEVINAGIQSCVSRQSIAELVFTVADYHPDIVILYDGVNDIGLPLTYESRPNFPYNFQTMEEAWDRYRQERQESLWRLAVERSQVMRLLRARFHPDKKLAPTPDAPFAGTNALSPDALLSDTAFVKSHIAAYLSNWRKLVALSAAYRYKPVCVLSAAPGLDPEFALPRTMREFHLDMETANKWTRAMTALYDEAGLQIQGLRAAYPEASFLDLSRFFKPSDNCCWDLVHVYDEMNMRLAARILGDIEPTVEASLQAVTR